MLRSSRFWLLVDIAHLAFLACAGFADKAATDAVSSTSSRFISPPNVKNQLKLLNKSIEKMEQVIALANSTGCSMMLSASRVSTAMRHKAAHIQHAVHADSNRILLEKVDVWVDKLVPAVAGKFDAQISNSCRDLNRALLNVRANFMDHYEVSLRVLKEAVAVATHYSEEHPALLHTYPGDPVAWLRGLIHPEQHTNSFEQYSGLVENVDEELTNMAREVTSMEESSRSAVKTSVVDVITDALDELRTSCKTDVQFFVHMLPRRLANETETVCNSAKKQDITKAADAFEEKLPSEVKHVKKLIRSASSSVSILREYWRAVQLDGAIQDRATRLRTGKIGHK